MEELGVGAGAGGLLEDHDGDVVVVVGVDAEGAHEAVADDGGGALGSGEGAFEGGDAFVDVLAAAFDQAVGVEDGGGAGAQRDGAGGVEPAAGAQGRAGGVGGAADGAVLVADQDGEVAGGGVREEALVGVVDGVDAGGDLAGVDLGGEAVEELQDLVGRQVEAGVRADGGAELAHDGGGADAAAHDVSDDEGGAAGAEGDDVVPVAADGRFGAAGLVGGGDAEVVGLFQLLGQEGALEGDGGFALAAFAGAQAVDGFGVVGDVGEVDQDPGVVGVRFAVGGGLGELDGGAGDGVRAAAAGGGAVLGGTGFAAALDLVEEGQQAEVAEFGEGEVCGLAGGAGAEAGGVGVVDVGDAVFGAVDEGDEGREQAEDLPYGELVEGGYGGERCRAGAGDGGVGGAGAVGGRDGVGGRAAAAGTEPSPRLAWAAACSFRAAARRCVPGNRALQRVKFTAFKPRGVASGRCVARGR